jgi:integrase
MAIAQYCASRGEFGAMFLVLAGFDSFLRTREMLSLCWSDVSIDDRGRGAISLAHTKVGQRNAAFEAAVILDPVVGASFRRAASEVPRGTSRDFYIFPGTEARFYALFSEALVALGLSEYGFRPYSLRRGGATAFYRATRNMGATIERGRWSTARIARIYINDGLAKEIEVRLPESVLVQLQRRARLLLSALQ